LVQVELRAQTRVVEAMGAPVQYLVLQHRAALAEQRVVGWVVRLVMVFPVEPVPERRTSQVVVAAALPAQVLLLHPGPVVQVVQAGPQAFPVVV
jgi:hypothetical protein